MGSGGPKLYGIFDPFFSENFANICGKSPKSIIYLSWGRLGGFHKLGSIVFFYGFPLNVAISILPESSLVQGREAKVSTEVLWWW